MLLTIPLRCENGEFGKEQIKVHATFDGKSYDGSVVNMGAKNADGSVCYILEIRKDIQAKIGKYLGDYGVLR